MTQVALPVGWIKNLASINNFPLCFKILSFMFQFPDMRGQSCAVRLVPISEAATVTIIPLFEGVSRETRICAGCSILFYNFGPVYHCLSQAVSSHRAGLVSPAVTTSLFGWLTVLLCLVVVLSNGLLHVWHTFV